MKKIINWIIEGFYYLYYFRNNKEPNKEEIINLWLKKYHNLTVKQLIERYPEQIKSPDWFKMFPCTQEQEDNWIKSTKLLLKRKYKKSDLIINLGWWSIYLDCSPYVERD